MQKYRLAGMNSELRGNQRRMMTALPIFAFENGLRIAPKHDWKFEDTFPISENEASQGGTLFTSEFHCDIEEGSSIAVFGADYFDALSVLGGIGNGEVREVLRNIESGLELPDGSRAIPMQDIYLQRLRKYFGETAALFFDREIIKSNGRAVTRRAQLALLIVDHTPEIPKDQRAIRKLLALRIEKDQVRYESSLELSANRLELTARQLEDRVIRWLGVLVEDVPFTGALNDADILNTYRTSTNRNPSSEVKNSVVDTRSNVKIEFEIYRDNRTLLSRDGSIEAHRDGIESPAGGEKTLVEEMGALITNL